MVRRIVGYPKAARPFVFYPVTINLDLTPVVAGWATRLWWSVPQYPDDWFSVSPNPILTDSNGRAVYEFVMNVSQSGDYYLIKAVILAQAHPVTGEMYGGFERAPERTYGFTTKTWDINLVPAVLIASVNEINLPDKLAAGDSITGYARIENIGDIRGTLRCLLITEWNGDIYSTEQVLDPGGILEATLPAGVVMPKQDAVTTVKAEHLEDGVWITDDVKTH